MNYYYMRNRFRHLVFYLREYLFPSGCSLCGAALYGGDTYSGDRRRLRAVKPPHVVYRDSMCRFNGTYYGLCESCHAQMEHNLKENRKGDFCDYCGKPLISEHGRCLSCRQEDSRAFDGVKVLFPYAGKYRKLLAAYKFGKNLALGNYLAEKMREALKEGDLGASIVPVPPRPGKIRNSGWDQVEYLARLLEREGGVPVSRCLKRLPSHSQKELGRESRRTNLQGRIITTRQVPQTAVVIDDVMTTGSTLDACAAVLKAHGAHTVYGLCLFYD